MEFAEYPDARRLSDQHRLATRVSPTTGYRHVGDLTWNWALTLDHPTPTALWSAGGTVHAWAWLDPPDGVMAQVDPEHPELADAVLDWAASASASVSATAPVGESPLRMELAGTEAALIAAVRRRGWTAEAGGPFMLSLRRALTGLPTVDVPAGFTVRPVAGPDEYAARIAVHGAAFGSTALTVGTYHRLSTVYPYDGDLDLVVVGPAGDLVAYCQGWYDPVAGIGEFEPVGTVPGYRRRGLARAVCLEALHRFAARGGTRAVVYCRGDDDYPVPRLVYGALGFTEVTRTTWYVAPSGGT